MIIQINENTLQLMIGDITKQHTDSIVNAANGSLLGGGGVDGAIHRAAGPELLQACKDIRKIKLKGEFLPTGEAVITKGYKLRAKYVIHTVGPIWQENKETEQSILLANCYQNSLQLAHTYSLSSISFPSISTGAYNYPIEKASTIALNTISMFLQNNAFGKVVITLFSEDDFHIYKHNFTQLFL